MSGAAGSTAAANAAVSKGPIAQSNSSIVLSIAKAVRSCVPSAMAAQRALIMEPMAGMKAPATAMKNPEMSSGRSRCMLTTNAIMNVALMMHSKGSTRD